MSGGYLGKISGIFGEVKPTIAKVGKKVVRVEKGGVHRNQQENKSKKIMDRHSARKASKSVGFGLVALFFGHRLRIFRRMFGQISGNLQRNPQEFTPPPPKTQQKKPGKCPVICPVILRRITRNLPGIYQEFTRNLPGICQECTILCRV